MVESPLDYQRLVAGALQQLKASVPFDSASMLVINEEALTAYTSREFPRTATASNDHEIAAWVIEHRQAAIISDVRSDPRFKGNDPVVRSIAAIPLAIEQDILGVLTLRFHEPTDFSSEYIALMESIASQIALLLWLETQHSNETTDEERSVFLRRVAGYAGVAFRVDDLLISVAKEISTSLTANLIMFWLPDPATNCLVLHEPSAIGVPDFTKIPLLSIDSSEIISTCYRINTPSLSQHTQANPELLHSELMAMLEPDELIAVPVSARQQALGVLVVGNLQNGNLEIEHLDLLLATGFQIGVALSNIQLYASEHKRAQLMTLINRIGSDLTTILTIDDLRVKVVQTLGQVLGYPYIRLLTVEPGNLFCETRFDGSEVQSHIRTEALPGLSHRAFRLGRSYMVRDVSTEAEYVPPEGLSETGSAIYVPIRSGGRIYGLLEVYGERVGVFEDSDRTALETFATEVAIALDKTSLYQAEQQRSELLERIQHVSQMMTSELDLEMLLTIAVTEVCSIFRVDAASIMLYNAETDDFRIRVGHNLGHRFVQEHYISVHSFKERYARLHGPVIFTDYKPTDADQNLFKNEKIENSISIPFWAGNDPLGVIHLYIVRGNIDYLRPEPSIAQLLSQQIGIAIQNAFLFTQSSERAKQLEEANRLKSEFLANISHELRTPLNSIIGFTDIILNGVYGEVEDKIRDRLITVHTNSLNLQALIDDLLDLSRIEAGRMDLHFEAVDVSSQIQTACATLEPQIVAKGLTLKREIQSNLPPIWGDSFRLRQVLLNFLSNAYKFTESGQITIKAYSEEREKTAYVHIEVEDTGIGISHESQSIIFDEFRQADGSVTRRFGGTGLGLAITRRLVKMMSGHIWVNSEPGEGSTFHVLIPTPAPRIGIEQSALIL